MVGERKNYWELEAGATACKQATSRHSEGGTVGEGKQGKKKGEISICWWGGEKGAVGVGTCCDRAARPRALPDICERLKSDFR